MAESSNRQKQLFLEALDLPSPAERAEFLARACGGDEALRRQVEAMLQAHAVPDSFLEKPAAALGMTSDAAVSPPPDRPPAEGPGTRIGPYKLLEQIGEGGMGAVWMAEQTEPVKRRVALKLIKPGMDSAQVLARFEAERQALALMDHPNIARVLDAGATTSGQPYFVMELVKGVPFTRYCDERRLRPRERVALFVPVCQAVQHAHQKGIIHRDLKPSNVLVALYDGKPVPKVIDFGIAKATREKLTERTLFTGFGALVGTLEYMSPEQAELNQLDIDTRSDIYSLGVLLYEVLTGSTPLGHDCVRENALLDVLLMIHKQEPPTPSKRLSTSRMLATLSEQRQTEPARLARLVRGELDWIVMKALEKDRGRRYQSAALLGQDVKRYLRDEPVEAGPPGAAYRLRKFVRRHRGAVAAAAVVLLALLAGIGGTAWGLVEAHATGLQLTKALDQLKQTVQKERQARLLADKNAEEARKQALRADTARHAIQMEQILRAWERKDAQAMTRALEAVPGEFRKTWEYRFLFDLCRRQAVPLADRENVYCSAYSPDGETVATGHPWALRLWNPVTGAEIRKLEHPGAVLAVAYRRDGKRLVTRTFSHLGNVPDSLRAWEVATGKELWHAELPLNVQGFSPDGKLLLTTSAEGVVLLDADTGKVKLRLPNSRNFQRADFSPDGQSLVAAGVGPGVKILDARTGKPKLVLARDLGKLDPRYVAFSPGGDRVLVSAGEVRVWDARTGKELAGPIPNQNGEVGFTADGQAVVFANWDGVRVVDLASGKERPPTGSPGKTTCTLLSPDGARVVWGGFVYAVGKATPERFSLPGLETVRSDALVGGFMPDGKQVYAVCAFADRTVRFWDAATGQELRRVKPPPERGRPGQLTPDGRGLVYSDNDSGIYRIDFLDSGKEWVRLTSPPRWVWASVLSPDNRWVGQGGGDGVVKVWDAAKRQEYLRFSFPEKDPVSGLAFNPDGRLVAAGNPAGAVQVWDLTTRTRLVALRCRGSVRRSVFFPDGKRLLTWAGETMTVWELATGEAQLSFPCPDAGHPVLLSPDGSRVFSGLKVWDTATGQDVFTLPSSLKALALSPDGRCLLTAPFYGVYGVKMLVAP